MCGWTLSSSFPRPHSTRGPLPISILIFEPTLDTCWFGRVVLLCRFRVKTDMKDDKGRSVLMDCDCALIDCLYDFAPGGYKCIFVCQSKTLSKQCANQH